MRAFRRFSRVAVVSQKAAQVRLLLKKHGFSVVSSPSAKPDVVVAFGGDGTILESERRYPGVPKLSARDSRHCHLCTVRYAGKHAREVVCWSCLQTGIDALKDGAFDVVSHAKVDAVFGKEKLTGLNEVQLHNPDPRRAVRFSIAADGRTLAHDVIGDGVLLATPFGAGGYFRSICRQSFDSGFGLALNNPVEAAGPWFFSNTPPSVHVKMERGPGWVLADNAARKLIVPNGGKVVFRRSPHVARFVALR